MSDLLLQLGQNPQARRLIKALGLPLPIPQNLERARGAWEERPLADRAVVLGGVGTGRMAAPLAKMLAEAGADPIVIGEGPALEPFRAPGEAFGRPAHAAQLTTLPEGKFHGVVFDGSELADPGALRALYEHFHVLAPRIAASGRAVVIGRPAATAKTPEAAAARAALEGFVRSLAKEIGKRGATAQLLVVDDGAEERAAAVLRFILSPRSAFVTAQPIHVTTAAKGADLRHVRALEKKVAIVTGAARGIGEETARLLAGEGAHVICVDRPDDDALVSKVAREIGGSVLLADVTDPEAPARIVAEAKKHGGVDVVVHNAGVTRDKTIGNMTAEQWEQAVDINLGAVARITKALLPDALRDGGRVICLSSVAGIAGNVGQTNYAASKSGIIGFVRALAPQVASRGITVNAIAPGFIETRLTAAIPVMIREVGRRLSALGQGGQPRDVAEAITFLSQPASVGVTGSVLRVCGGALIGA